MPRFRSALGPAWRWSLGLVAALSFACGAARAEDTPAASEAEGSPPSIHLLLEDGTELQVQRVRTGTYGLRVELDGGRDSVVSASGVRRITDEKGRDRTKEVLGSGREIRVGGPEPPKVEEAPPSAARFYVGTAGGPAYPAGPFGDLAARGYGVAASFERRTRRRETFGLKLDWAEFGGTSEVEAAFAESSGGAVDQLRFRLWGVGVFGRYLLLPDRRVVPFLHLGFGVAGYNTSLSGDGEEGSATAFAFTRDLGLGAAVPLGKGLAVELFGGLSWAGTTGTNIRLESAPFTSEGTIRYSQVKFSLARRLGGH